MATKEIKNRIVLEGEKEYNAALKEANRNLKTLKSELRAETAELGRNATEQQKNETRVKNLKKQIAEQEKVVKTYEKALEEVRQKYGDNEDAIASWEQKLNNARATLGNMKNDLDGLGDSLGDVQRSSELAVVATASIADAMGEIGTAGQSVADSIEGIFTGLVDTVTDMVTGLWDLISETAAKANNWTDIAGYWNTDAQEIQKWARAVGSAQNDFQDLQSAVSKLVLGDHDKIAELTHVSYVGAGMDEWKYAMDVLGNIAAMDHVQRNSVLDELFGEKKATKLMDLMNDWQTIVDLTAEYDGNTTGYGMTDEQLKTMDELYVQIGTLQEKWTALKDSVAAGLGTAVMDLTVNAEGVLDGIAAFMNADGEGEREAALDQIRENVEEFFRRLAEIIRNAVQILSEVGTELSGSDDPVVGAVGNILSGIADALQWMIDNQDAVRSAFEAIFGFWLITKLAAVAGQLSAVLLQINAIKAFKGLSLGGTAAAQAAAGGASSGGGWLGGLLASTGAKAVGGTLAGLGVLFENAFKPQGNDDIFTAEEEAAYEREHADEIAWQRNKFAWNKAVTEGGFDPEDLAETLGATDAQRIAAENFWDEWRENPMDYSDAAWDEFEGAFAGNEELFGKIDDLMTRLTQMTDDDSWRSMEDLPGWMWTMDPSKWDSMGVSGSSGDGITSGDLQNFRGLPGQIQRAAQAGTAAGVSGIQVQMDGAAVGRLVAPYVSAIIAQDII